MRTLFLTLLVCVSSYGNANAGTILWLNNFKGGMKEFYTPGCIGPKDFKSNKVELCVKEAFRTKSSAPINAFVAFYSKGQINEFKVVNVSEWKFIGQTTDYAFNDSFYERTITLEDHVGRQSDIVDVISPNFSYGIISIKSITGTLPNGEVLPSLTNFYSAPSFIKNLGY